MTTISNNNIAEAIYLASKGHNHEDQHLFSSKVVKFLAKKRLLSKAPDILSRLSKIINNHEGRIVAKIWSAKKLSENVNKELKQILSKRYSAKEVILEEKIDEKLLGGFKVEVNDEVIDFTLKNKIGKLQEYLTESI